MVQLMPLPPHHLLLREIHTALTLLVPAYPRSPGKENVKRVYSCYGVQVVAVVKI